MRVTAAGVVLDALALYRRDRAVLLPIAGLFWFLPAYAVALLTPPPPERVAGAEDAAAWEGLSRWLAAQAPWYALAWAVGLWGAATVYVLYLRPERPDLRGALAMAASLWPRLLVASGLVALMAAGGLLLWVLPGLYLLGRFLPVGPALTAERPLSGLGAIGRAWALTRGSGLSLAAVAAATVGFGWIGSQPLLLLDGWLREQGGGNPVAVAIVDAGAAAISMVAGLASAMFAVAAYRRLAR
jgi:hypothetical protein